MVLVCTHSGHTAGVAGLTINSVVISIFAIVILSTLGLLFRANHPELVGGDEDPEDGATVAATVFIAVIIYAVGSCLIFEPRI
jgi:hypothetical protein